MRRFGIGFTKKLNDMSLKYKLLVLYLVFIFIPITINNLLFYNRISNDVMSTNMNRITSSVEKTKNEFRRMVNGVMTLSHAIYKEDNLYSLLDREYSNLNEYFTYYRDYLRPMMDKYLIAYDIIENICIYTNNLTIPEAGSYCQLNDNVRKSSWFLKLADFDNDILICFFIDDNPLYPKKRVSLFRYLDNLSQDRYTKILRIDLNYDRITQILSDNGNIGDVFLIDGENNIVCSTKPNVVTSEVLPATTENLGAGRKDFVVSLDFEDVTSLSGWKLTGVFDSGQITEALRNTIIFSVMVSIICISTATTAILLISKSYNKRIIKISRHMDKIKKEEFCLIEGNRSKDEIGLLIEDFNNMIQKIRSLIEDVYKADLQKKNLELERKQAELNALQSQVNPHFLFNTLESLRVRSLLKDETETAEMIHHLSKIYRGMFIWKNDIITVKEEIEFINDYLELQKYRFADKFDYEVNVPEDVLACRIPKMTIQPFIENSCVHGMKKQIDEGFIYLGIEKLGDRLVINIRDNGIGMSEEKLSKILSSLNNDQYFHNDNIGIKNVYNRLKLYYGDQFQFDIRSSSNVGTQIYISIPLDFALGDQYVNVESFTGGR